MYVTSRTSLFMRLSMILDLIKRRLCVCLIIMNIYVALYREYLYYTCLIVMIMDVYFEQKLKGREGETERSWSSWKRAVVSKPAKFS